MKHTYAAYTRNVLIQRENALEIQLRTSSIFIIYVGWSFGWLNIFSEQLGFYVAVSAV